MQAKANRKFAHRASGARCWHVTIGQRSMLVLFHEKDIVICRKGEGVDWFSRDQWQGPEDVIATTLCLKLLTEVKT